MPKGYNAKSQPVCLPWLDLQQLIRDEMKKWDPPAMQKWVGGFLKSEIVLGLQKVYTLPCALQRIHALEQTPGNEGLLFLVLDVCYCAATYKDHHRERRTKDANVLADISRQHTAVKRLRTFLKKYSHHASLALGGALLDWKQRRHGKVIFPNIQGERVPLSQVFDELLTCYDSALSHGLHGAKRGPWLHRVQAGALLYPDTAPLDKTTSQPNARLNSLLFYLVFLLRQATSPTPIQSCLGMRMPESGTPHYPLVAVLANAAIPDACKKASRNTADGLLSPQQVRQRVTRLQHQGVMWADWPT
jgi:hypothetical protein